MKDKIYNNADSFAISFDQEWDKVECNDLNLKIIKVIDKLSDHPFVVSEPKKAKEIANFRIYTLRKLK